MSEEKFIAGRDRLIELMHESKVFCEFKKVDARLYLDPELIELDQKKEELIDRYSCASSTEEEDILTKLNVIQTKINALPLVARYYELRKKLKAIVEPLNKGIFEKLYL